MKYEIVIAKYKGKPIIVHALVLFALAYFVARYAIMDGVVMFVCYMVLILAHELGHAYYVTKYNYRLIKIKLYPIHGYCRFEHDKNYPVHPLVSAGGLIVQSIIVVIFAVFYLLLQLSESYTTLNTLSPLFDVFLFINLITIALNALPIPGLDGAEIWPYLINYLKKNRKTNKTTHKKPKTKFIKKSNQKENKQSSDKIVDIALMREKKQKNKTKLK
ncbi:MAG: hypothetical protein HRU38_06555 [Saccharospirillaceae bacterium]|nr:hypothetical protein [Pseudomonadales bacterium]NRB78314.1 hypothetical protein [Saccharospirillaceae bacterium]